MEPATGTPDSTLLENLDLRSLWFWSPDAAPRSVDPQDIDLASLPSDAERLRVRVVDWQAYRGLNLRLVGAPSAMWEEVPENLLPTWAVPEGGLLSLPLDPEKSWRLRLTGEGVGTWWRDLEAGRRSVSLRPIAAAAIDLEVVGETSQPVAEAQIYVVEGATRLAEENKHLTRFRSTNGIFTVPPVPDVGAVTLMVTAENHLPAALRGFPSSLPRRVLLRPGAVVSGRFLDPEGAPVADAGVEIEAVVGGDFPSFLKLLGKSGADGRWEIEAVPPSPATVVGKAKGFAPVIRRLEIPPTGADLGDLVFQASLRLSVEVANDLEEPVAGATLETLGGASTVTDAAGKAVLRDLPAEGSVEIELRAPGHLPAQEILRPPHTEPIKLRLRRAFRAHGRFLDPAGSPVVRGSVTWRSGRASDRRPIEGDGRFGLELAPGQAYVVELGSPSTQKLRFPLPAGFAGEDRDLGDLRAPPGLVVTGRLLSASAAMPVPGAKIWTPRRSAAGPLAAWFYRDLLTTRSDADGFFTLRGLAPEPAALRIDAPGFARRTLGVRHNEGVGEVDLGEIELDFGATLHILAEGFEDEGVTARVDQANRWLELDMLTAPFAAGAATLRHVAPGQVTVSAVRERELLCEEAVTVAPEETELTVRCKHTSMRLRGEVRVGGYATGPGLLSWQPPAVGSTSIIMTRQSATGLRQHQVFGQGRPQVDVNVLDGGYFETEKLRPGLWSVIWYPSSGIATEPKSIELPRAESAEIVVDFAALRVVGAVEDEEGRAVAGARVRELTSGTLVFSAVDGRFEVSGLDPGTRYFKAEIEERVSPVAEVEVLVDQTPDPIVLRLATEDPSPRLQLQVLDAAEQPISGAFVFFEGEGGQRGILTAAGDGRAELALDPPLPARVRFATFGAGDWTLGSWMPLPSAGDEPTVLIQGRTGSLELRAAADGEPSYVELVSATGWDLSRLLTQVGMRPVLRPGDSLRLTGLPPGPYTLSTASTAMAVAIEDGSERSIDL
ncbi:MAG: carboxypeptidase-like regulatory domain-containing protein [Acidobacteriota bacterium]